MAILPLETVVLPLAKQKAVLAAREHPVHAVSFLPHLPAPFAETEALKVVKPVMMVTPPAVMVVLPLVE